MWSVLGVRSLWWLCGRWVGRITTQEEPAMKLVLWAG